MQRSPWAWCAIKLPSSRLGHALPHAEQRAVRSSLTRRTRPRPVGGVNSSPGPAAGQGGSGLPKGQGSRRAETRSALPKSPHFQGNPTADGRVGPHVVCRNLTADVVQMSYTTFTAVPKARVDDGVLRESLATTRVACLSGC